MLGWVVRILTLAAVLGAPWAFGGAYFTRLFWPPLLLAVVVWTFALGRRHSPIGVAPLLLAPIALAALLGVLQWIPLDAALLDRIDPKAAAAWRGADFVSRPPPKDLT